MSVAEAKNAARIAARDRRSAAQGLLGLDAAPAFVRHFFERIPLAPGSVISGYAPISSEADPMAILREADARGFPCALPSVEAPASPLTFRRWRPDDPLIDGPHGTRAPDVGAPILMPQIVIVPLLAFDRAGRRLGYGGGYYDRTLAFLRARGENTILAVGLAFSAQEADELPEDSGDQRLDWIVTERGAWPVG
ncbi:MAG: 5-formyltetrahydrofolate cyclo-ligase [Parvibaculum sedimenti]|uniref:5-formyltetrahydrofolate cyclo-ligase n=1 Tax=Parvibaculum sedimenti TaxID=2608632 RepID=UPI003BB5EFBD